MNRRFLGKRLCSECGDWMRRKVAWVESPGPGGLFYYWECRDERCAHIDPEIAQA